MTSPDPAEHARSGRPSWRAEFLTGPKHGPLPALLALLTIVTGLVDAVSILALGRVFVANMTGNVVFIGFAIAGAPGFSATASLLALAGFLVGAGIGGLVGARLHARRAWLVIATCSAEFVLLVLAAVVLASAAAPYGHGRAYLAVVASAVALGMQNATARRLAVPDFTTTVLTMTLTGLAADIRGADGRAAVRRSLSIAAMLGGAVAGALLVLHGHCGLALLIAGLLSLAVVIVMVGVTRFGDHEWDRPHP